MLEILRSDEFSLSSKALFSESLYDYTMVFEERLILNTYEEAHHITQYLKTQRISSQVLNEPVFETRLTLAGKYNAIMAFLIGYPNYIKKHASENDGEQELQVFEDPDIENLKLLPELLDSYREIARKLTEGVNQGDVFCPNHSDYLYGKNDSFSAPNPEQFFREIEVFKILYLNQIMSLSYSGATLTKRVLPNDLIYYLPWVQKSTPDEKVLDLYRVTIVRCFSGKIRYVVIMGPEAILHEDFQTLLYELSQKGVDPDALLEMMDRHINKVRLVRNIVGDIMEGDTSVGDLKEMYQEVPAVIDGFGRIQDRSDYSPEFIEEMVAELKRMDMIRGKDYRLRLGHLIYSRKII